MDPWLVGGQIAPLSRLIKDKQKKRNFLRAMMSYLDKAEILNLKETVSIIEDEIGDKNKWIIPYKSKVDEFNERLFINHTNLVDFSIQLNDEINFQRRRGLTIGDPFKMGIFTSTLDNDKKDIHINSDAISSSISHLLLIVILVLNLIRFRFN